MSSATLILDNVVKRFNRRPIFENVTASVTSPGSVAITGKNGSGKSTLVKIIAGVLSTTSGTVAMTVDGKPVPREERYRKVGFVSPYLSLYDEFSAAENVRLLEAMRTGVQPNARAVFELLNQVGLEKRLDDRVGTYSSGMKQRVKYAVALIHQPAVLILDEPTSNLDADGVAFVRSIAERQSREGILIVATNDQEESNWCTQHIILEKG